MIQADSYFFDIDGTLLVTRDLVHWNALHQAMLEVHGVDTSIEGLSYHGKTDIAILKAALRRVGIPDITVSERLGPMLAVVSREVTAHAKEISAEVCRAVPQFLKQIQQSGKLLGIASGNLESVGWHKISAVGLRDFFSVGSFGDHCEQRAEIFANAIEATKRILGARSEACFIGDTPDDILAARSVNAHIIAVSSGTFSLQQLAAWNPDLCCTSCASLLLSES